MRRLVIWARELIFLFPCSCSKVSVGSQTLLHKYMLNMSSLFYFMLESKHKHAACVTRAAVVEEPVSRPVLQPVPAKGLTPLWFCVELTTERRMRQVQGNLGNEVFAAVGGRKCALGRFGCSDSSLMHCCWMAETDSIMERSWCLEKWRKSWYQVQARTSSLKALVSALCPLLQLFAAYRLPPTCVLLR